MAFLFGFFRRNDFSQIVQKINALEQDLKGLAFYVLKEKSLALRARVQNGEPLAAMAGDGAVLDLEIRKGGAPVNPLLWLRGEAGPRGAG